MPSLVSGVGCCQRLSRRGTSRCRIHSGEKIIQLVGIQTTVAANAGAEVNSEWTYFFDRALYILRGEAAGKKHRDGNFLANATAQSPIVDASGAPKLLYRQ